MAYKVNNPDQDAINLAKKVQKAIETQKEWYSLKSLLGFGEPYSLFFLIGGREAGKSYAALDFFLHEFFTKGKTFTWLRLTEASTRKMLQNNGLSFIDAGLMLKYNIDSRDLKTKGFWVFYKDKPMAKILALSTFYNDKGVPLFEDKDFEGEVYSYNICLDEFQLEVGQKQTLSIAYCFVQQLENLVRHKTNVRCFIIGNATQQASELLSLVNFIPEQFGRYKLKKKRTVIDYIPPSEKYIKRRSKSLPGILMPDHSNFTNVMKYDRSKIYKGRLYKPQYIIQFRNNMFTVWDNNIVARHNKENKPVIAMVPLLIDNSVYKSELRDEIILMDYEKKFRFKDLITQKLFDRCIKEIKGVKG